ncbi:MAG: maleylacetoacetate isomerase [Chitinophagaceae bacterium]|nr:maleylacetoacetate isomerase [Oligoflexus sp.]
MDTPTLELFHYWRSSCSWRVRWALALKGLPYKSTPINLLKKEQSDLSFLKINPSGQVPALSVNGKILSESIAILEWLEETFPISPLLPKDPWLRAEIRSYCAMIASGIQPVTNLRITGYYSNDPEKKAEWARHFMDEGFIPVETMLRKNAGTWSFGETFSMADLFLVPQVYNAHRFAVDMSRFPLAQAIYERSLKTAACDQAAPHNQPGAVNA